MAKKQSKDSDSFFDSGEGSLIDYESDGGIDNADSTKPSQARFLGMTAPQRFVIAVILFLMVCVLGAFCLVLTGKIWIAF
jgi:hypothetical protein